MEHVILKRIVCFHVLHPQRLHIDIVTPNQQDYDSPQKD